MAAKTKRKRRVSKKQRAFEKQFQWKLFGSVLLLVVLTSVLYTGKTQIFKWLIQWRTYAANESSEPESRVHDAINWSFETRKSEYKREQLFELLSDPVRWYNKSYRLNHRFPSYSDYDLFCYLEKPEVSEIDFGGSNYEVSFHGVYRYRIPKDSLLAFESGLAIMKNGLITSLTTQTNPNEYHLDWVNSLWRWYFVWCLIFGAFAGLIFFFVGLDKELFRAMVRRWLGV